MCPGAGVTEFLLSRHLRDRIPDAVTEFGGDDGQRRGIRLVLEAFAHALERIACRLFSTSDSGASSPNAVDTLETLDKLVQSCRSASASAQVCVCDVNV